MKKLVALMLAAIMVLGIASAVAEDVTLNLWTIAVESDSSYQTFIDGIAAFEAAHPGVKINHEPTQNEQYKIKIKAAMSAGTDLPDVFFTWGMGFLGEFVAADRVLCLDEYYDAYASELPKNMCANASYDGKLYGVPYTMSEVVLFANMELLASVGYDHIPTTIEEMNECCDKLLEAGITPFGVSGKELWCLSEYLEPLMIKSVGTERLIKMYNGEESWNNPDVIAAVEAFQNMVNKNYFDPNAAALGNDEVKTNFIAGKYAFYQNGSWNCGDIARGAEFEVQACMFPVVDAEKSSLYQMIGGPNDTLAVTASSANPELCAKTAFALGQIISREGNLNGAGLPTWAVTYDTSACNKLSNQVADMVALSDGMVLFGDNFLSADAANTYLDYIAQIFAGDIGAEDFAKGLAADLQ